MGSIKGQKHNPHLEGKYAHINPNDVVFTPDWLAKQICEMFPISGKVLEPCKGEGAFLQYLPPDTDWCEIAEGRNFYEYNKKVDWLVTNPPYCFTRGEVLTYDGWKNISDVKIGEFVLSTTENKKIEWKEVTNVINQKYKGNIITCNKRNTSFEVTPNHKMFTDNGLKEILNFNESEYFPRFDYKWNSDNIIYDITIPYCEYEIKHHKNNTRIIKYDKKIIKIENWLKFFGFWLADGCTCKHHYGVSIKQHKDNANLVRDILDGIGYKYNEYEHENKISFTIYNRQLWDYMSVYGDSYTKYIPKYIKELPKQYIELLLNYYMKGDLTKCRKHLVVSTVSVNLKDDLQECFLKCGVLLHFNYNKRTKLWDAISNPINPFKINKYKDLKTKNYDGDIFCLSVKDNHSFLVRFDNSVYFTGNSDFNRFLDHAFELSDNVVLLVPVAKLFKSMGTLKTIFNYGGFVSIHALPASKAGFPFGFPCGVYYMKRGYTGQTNIELLKLKEF